MASKVLVLCQHRELLKFNEWVIITYYFDQVALPIVFRKLGQIKCVIRWRRIQNRQL